MMMKLIAAIYSREADGRQTGPSEARVGKMTVSNVIGCGSQGGHTESYRGTFTEVNLLYKVRFEIAVNDDFVKPAVEAIIRGARTGKIGMERSSWFPWRNASVCERESRAPMRSFKITGRQ
jgi:nitrogen regulatory protein P-II 1